MSSRKNHNQHCAKEESPRVEEHDDDYIQDVLDLHGCTKARAIQSMTIFFDGIRHKFFHENRNMLRKKYMVKIITGTGSHSKQGPVLRTAVTATLEKREMSYTMSRCRGAFLVDALSGEDLYEDLSHRYDSKLILVPPNQYPNTSQNQSHYEMGKSRLLSTHTSDLSHSTTAPQFSREEFPSSSEVASDDAVIQSVLEMSVRDANRNKSMQSKEEIGMKQAIMKSLELCQIQQLEEDQNKEQIEAVIEWSRKENEESEYEENRLLERILFQSQRDEEENQRIREEKDTMNLQYAIKISRSEYEEVSCEEEDTIQYVLNLSASEYRQSTSAS